MSSTDGKLNGSPEPFRRPVVWGRPPQTTFRAGPLPKGGTLPPLPEPPVAVPAQVATPPKRPARSPAAPGANIFSGSMIPKAAPVAPPGLTPVAEAPASTPTAEPAPSEAAVPDLIVRPLPAAPVEIMPQPAPAPEPAPSIQQAPSVDRSPVQRSAATDFDFDKLPPVHPGDASVDDTPAAITRTRATERAARPSSRIALYAGLAVTAVIVAGAAYWIYARPAPAPATTTPVSEPLSVAVTDPAPTSNEAAAPLTPAPEAVTVPEAIDTLPVTTPTVRTDTTATRPATPPAPARTTTSTPTIAQTSPPASQPAARAQPPAPVIVTAPLDVPAVSSTPPTAATRPSSDPDAPITTRPQALD